MTGLIAAFACATPEAWAEDVKPAATTPEQVPPRWSIGAGIGQPGYTYPIFVGAMTGGSGSVTSSLGGRAPLAIALQVETRVSPSVWLTLGGQASYASGTSSTPSAAAPAPSPGSTWWQYLDDAKWVSRTLGATAGARYVANPGGEVEVGGYATLGLMRTLESGTRTRTTRTLTTSETGEQHESDPVTAQSAEFIALTTVGGELGLTFERAFTRNLALRFTTSLVSVASSTGHWVTARDGGAASDATNGNLSAGLALSPKLELHLLF